MLLESLNSPKFKPLTTEAQLQVRGGEITGADSVYSSTEWSDEVFKNPDGTTYRKWRVIYWAWTGDEIDGRDKCYYGSHFEAGDWQH
jgi:hypothetical protein